ncbi:hypothetical protein TCON_1500 [Astathelohania contejeani]|uniref:ATP synthase F0 subunit 8 n=1 Tax=Astathelohania contejeani TaxID=164912 RepID=A0ABQ7HYQ4_9MICR|nr:hypothetical protein TCON_1500 [Thelohania contejeani]
MKKFTIILIGIFTVIPVFLLTPLLSWLSNRYFNQANDFQTHKTIYKQLKQCEMRSLFTILANEKNIYTINETIKLFNNFKKKHFRNYEVIKTIMNIQNSNFLKDNETVKFFKNKTEELEDEIKNLNKDK